MKEGDKVKCDKYVAEMRKARRTFDAVQMHSDLGIPYRDALEYCNTHGFFMARAGKWRPPVWFGLVGPHLQAQPKTLKPRLKIFA